MRDKMIEKLKTKRNSFYRDDQDPYIDDYNELVNKINELIDLIAKTN